jgi:hypothetical protein
MGVGGDELWEKAAVENGSVIRLYDDDDDDKSPGNS